MKRISLISLLALFLVLISIALIAFAGVRYASTELYFPYVVYEPGEQFTRFVIKNLGESRYWLSQLQRNLWQVKKNLSFVITPLELPKRQRWRVVQSREAPNGLRCFQESNIKASPSNSVWRGRLTDLW